MEKEIKTEQIEKFEKVVGATFNINGIVVKIDKDENVQQIRFKIKDSEKDLTYKPSFLDVKTDKIKGLKVEQTLKKSYLVDDLPEKVFDINDLINDNGHISVKTDYTIMRDRNDEGEQVEYWFINNTDFENLIILN